MGDYSNGLVIRAQSGFYWVESEDGNTFLCRLRGRLKEQAQASNIVAIGDKVQFTEEEASDEVTGVIENVEERQSSLSRAMRTTGKRGAGQAEREHIIIANADQAIPVFSASNPKPDLQLLDYFLVAYENSSIPNILIVINKIDLVEITDIEKIFEPYQKMGYPLLYTSASENTGIERLRAELSGKISVFTGPSGVGKSSLLNQIKPGLARAVKPVSDYSSEGMHTTRDSALEKLEDDTYVADTPGIRSLMVWDIEPDELDAYFIDIAEYVDQCKFKNCTHSNEPRCAVRAAVENNEISPIRYKHYLELREQLADTYIIYQR